MSNNGKVAPTLNIPVSRTQKARTFLEPTQTEQQASESVAATTKKPKAADRKLKAATRFMTEHGISDISSIEFTRINCDIPKDLHRWLNIYARSSDDYSSMTEIVLELLGKFAKEKGFKVEK